MVETGIIPPLSIVAAGAFPGIMRFRQGMARQAVGVTSVIEAGHHPIAGLMAVAASAWVVVFRGFLGMAVGALAVEAVIVIVIVPISAGVVTAAAILAVVVLGCFLLVALDTIFDRSAAMVILVTRPGIGIVTLIAPAGGVLGGP